MKVSPSGSPSPRRKKNKKESIRFRTKKSRVLPARVHHARTSAERHSGTGTLYQHPARYLLQLCGAQHLTGKLSDGRSGNYPRQCGIRVGTFRPAQFTPTTCLYGDRVFQRRRTGCSPSDTRLAATGRFLGMPFPKGSSRRRPARIPQSAHYPLRRSGAGRRSRRYAISR